MTAAPDLIRFVADRGDGRLRLDQSVARHLRDVGHVSRNRIQGWIHDGLVTVDGVAAVRPSARVPERALVEIALPDGVRRIPPAPETTALSILHEDESLLVVNKPAGMVVHPSYKQTAGTLLNAVLGHRGDQAGAQPGIVTRLDKQTSGIVLIAMAPDVHRLVQADAAAGQVVKEYLAVVVGRPSPRKGTIALAIGRDPADRRRVAARADGAPAATRYQVLATRNGRSLVRCQLVTGRTHQIRLHMAASG